MVQAHLGALVTIIQTWCTVLAPCIVSEGEAQAGVPRVVPEQLRGVGATLAAQQQQAGGRGSGPAGVGEPGAEQLLAGQPRPRTRGPGHAGGEGRADVLCLVTPEVSLAPAGEEAGLGVAVPGEGQVGQPAPGAAVSSQHLHRGEAGEVVTPRHQDRCTLGLYTLQPLQLPTLGLGTVSHGGTK